MKLHQKGYLLVRLNKTGGLWDSEISAMALREYGQSGGYWENAVKVALEELAAAGLISRVQSMLTTADGRPTLSFQYAITDFGRQRMIDTGLIAEVAA